MVTDAAQLGEQVDYYRARAPEYDEWFRREGPYNWGEASNAKWRRDLDEVRAALDAFAPSGEVLELAYGTGEWTRRLAAHASSVTGIDAAPEMRDLARSKLSTAGVDNVELRLGDLFAWEPDRTYDVVFFAFWLSHVPQDRFGDFWDKVYRSLRPGGRFFLADNARVDLAARSELPGVVVRGSVVHHSTGALDLDASSDLRRLADGREFRIVKRSFDPQELEAELRDHGFALNSFEVNEFFLFGSGARGIDE